jgi:hypothetical protein
MMTMFPRMLKLGVVLLVVPVLAGCASSHSWPKRTITLRWQRLVDEDDQTCERCGDTQTELRLAAGTLERCLRPLNMDVELEKLSIDPQTFAHDTSQSNRILVDDRPLEDWLGGKVGMSLCGFCCKELGKNVRCRTVTLDGQTYEAIPAALIVRAGLLAAETALARESQKEACCSGARRSAMTSCCPKSRSSWQSNRARE